MKRMLIFGALVLVMVIVGIGVFLYNSIDPIVKGAIEKYGSSITGTAVSVGSVDISLKSGRGTIRDVRVKNPEGFDDDDAFRLREITIDLDLASLNRDPIVIDAIRISAPEVKLILDATGKSNISTIKANVDAYQASSSRKNTPKQDGGYEKRLLIEAFTFAQGKVHADATALGVEKRDLELPPLNLANLGAPNGDSPDAIGKAVSRAFMNAVMGVATRVVQDAARGEAEDAAKKALNKILGN